ncbi:3-hydroxyacyl-CoA dehydrogenase [Halopseudomonas sabulinigri]|uniref:3-hydroxyacyl-CoA dehydrogenase n=1 Tax=Halopseudomonas sabulinigri TaxID=472181 RepID=A0ABP9ZKK1_9GAMM
MSHPLHSISVLGAGVLGGQIAWHSAFKGKRVVVYDLFEDALDRCKVAHQQYAQIYAQDLGAGQHSLNEAHARLTYTSDLAEGVRQADLVIEAVPEIPTVKTSLYQAMAPLLQAHTLLATNSSTLLPRDFAAATGRPDRYCALHFAIMIWHMNLAEIMAHEGTSDETLSAVTEFAIDIGMVPIPVSKEQNGYVLNTWLVALLQAAQTLITNGVATPEIVDRTYMIVNRGCAMGPCGIMDVVGMKTCYDILQHWGTELNDEQMQRNASYIKAHFLDRGQLGLQSGSGYYTYPAPAYQRADFLAVPDKSDIASLIGKIRLLPR